MKDITVIGIDIAKNVFQIHGMNEAGKKLLSKRVSRKEFLSTMAMLPKCVVGMEACGGAHYWARELIKLGYEVKLMNPTHVKKYASSHTKNDARDAAACAEAVTRASTRFVAVKTETQSEIQAMHRARSHYIKERTALMNMIRGVLLESGIAIARGQSTLTRKLTELTLDECDRLRPEEKRLMNRLKDDLKRVEEEVTCHTNKILHLAREDESCKRLQTIEGIGPLSATAIVAKIGNGSEFRQGRDLSAYLGLVPKQLSSGDTQKLSGITKHGDRYIRQLLVHGGRACVHAAFRLDKSTGAYHKTDAHSNWIRTLTDRVGVNKASVAVANKNARMVVAVLKNRTTFMPDLAHGQPGQQENV